MNGSPRDRHGADFPKSDDRLFGFRFSCADDPIQYAAIQPELSEYSINYLGRAPAKERIDGRMKLPQHD